MIHSNAKPWKGGNGEIVLTGRAPRSLRAERALRPAGPCELRPLAPDEPLCHGPRHRGTDVFQDFFKFPKSAF